MVNNITVDIRNLNAIIARTQFFANQHRKGHMCDATYHEWDTISQTLDTYKETILTLTDSYNAERNFTEELKASLFEAAKDKTTTVSGLSEDLDNANELIKKLNNDNKQLKKKIKELQSSETKSEEIKTEETTVESVSD